MGHGWNTIEPRNLATWRFFLDGISMTTLTAAVAYACTAGDNASILKHAKIKQVYF